MVSIEDSYTIQETIDNNYKSKNFYKFLNGEHVVSHDSVTPREFIPLINSVTEDSKSKFDALYEEYTKRDIDESSPFVYDNYLIFSLVVGVLKYNHNCEWLIKLLIFRESNINEPEKSITISFKNLLKKNYSSKEGITSIVLAGLLLLENPDVNKELLVQVIRSNSNYITSAKKDFFLGAIILFTNDYIQAVSTSTENIRLEKFEKKFLYRVKHLEYFFYVCIIAFVAVFWYVLVNEYPIVDIYISQLNTVLGFFGIAILGFNQKIRKVFGAIIKWWFGYKK